MDWLRRILPAPVKDLLRPVYYSAIGLNRLITRILFRALRILLTKKVFLRLYHFVTEQIDTTISVDGIRFSAAERIPFGRAITLLSTEPDTICWIEHYIGNDDVLYDIGANIGLYSLYAAAKKGARVVAIEPMCTNYDILNRNIHLNELGDRITAYNLALHDQTTASYLNLSKFVAGKAGHGFIRPVAGTTDTEFEPVFKQGVIGLTLDDLVKKYQQPFPNHIKMDVDGNEPKIVIGMKNILRDQRLRSIAIELDLENLQSNRDALEEIQSCGFRLLTEETYVNLSLISWTTVRNYFLVRD